MKNIRKIIKYIAVCSVICITISGPTYAAKLNSDATIKIINYEQPSGGWKPGDSKNINFTITNNTNKVMEVNKISITEKSTSGGIAGIDLGSASNEMSKHTYVTIKDGDKIIVQKISLKDISGPNLSKVAEVSKKIKIPPAGTKQLDMIIEMDNTMENPAQALTKVLTLGAGYTLSEEGGGGGGGTNPPIDPEDPKPPVDPPIDPEDPKPPVEPPINPEDPKPPVEPPVNPEDPNPPVDPENPNPPIGPEDPSNPTPPDGNNGGNNNNNGSDVNGDTDKLPQTGGLVNGGTLTILGLGVAGVGIILDRKYSNKGGNSDE